MSDNIVPITGNEDLTFEEFVEIDELPETHYVVGYNPATKKETRFKKEAFNIPTVIVSVTEPDDAPLGAMWLIPE